MNACLRSIGRHDGLLRHCWHLYGQLTNDRCMVMILFKENVLSWRGLKIGERVGRSERSKTVHTHYRHL